MQKLLVVEDGRAVQRALKRLFEPEGFAVQLASDGPAALEALKENRPDLVLLDLRLPGMPGRDVCKQIKKDWPSLPVIIVSAKTDVWDKVLLLEMGADDYVTKPFSPRELLARVRAALRRTQKEPAEERTAFGEVAVDFAKMQVTRDGRSVTLTPQEFKLLKFLTQNPERVITREELLNEVWGYTNYPSTRTVDNHILKLRQKLEEDAEEPQHFKTVHAVGYKFVP
jgi:two-component system, OmpR family, alkaline phosphatase synthesis response regulator PhoP